MKILTNQCRTTVYKTVIICFIMIIVIPGSAQDNILNIKYDSVETVINENIYGQFLEHIFHSVEGGLYAEKINGQGFEGKDFEEFWEINFPDNLSMEECLVEDARQSLNGSKFLLFNVQNNTFQISQRPLFIQKGFKYSGFLWIITKQQLPDLSVSINSKSGEVISEVKLEYNRKEEWQQIVFEFTPAITDTAAIFRLSVAGMGGVFVDFISLMRDDESQNGRLRSDLFNAVKDVKPAFVRWPGGSFVSNYHWQDGIGELETRNYTQNFWGYHEYNSFGTDEFMDLCRRLKSEPLIVMNAALQNTKNIAKREEAINEGLNLIHYLNDKSGSEWSKLRAKNGHPEPYGVKYFQIDNEPMNFNVSGSEYGSYVNMWGPRLREIMPEMKIFACGNKRSYDVEWSRQVIEKAGEYIDYLGLHNYEYTREGYHLGIRRIESYLNRVAGFIRDSQNPKMKIAMLEWGITTPDDWRSGLHAAGMYILLERYAPVIEMSCPAIFIRRIGDTGWGKDAIINQNYYGWYPAPSYVVTKLFRDNYAPYRVASITENYMDAVVTLTEDRSSYIVKAVNYSDKQQTFTLNFLGKEPLSVAQVTRSTIKANLTDNNSLQNPGFIAPVTDTLKYAPVMRLAVEPYSVIVLKIGLEK